MARLLGELTSKYERRVSYDDVINHLLDIASRKEVSVRRKDLSSATRKLLEMIDQPFEEAGPEDYREYGYEDIEG
ncbi:MAG: hypothetical protein ACTSUQ_07470 [Candidatus Freyarchaeota archaeon]